MLHSFGDKLKGKLASRGIDLEKVYGGSRVENTNAGVTTFTVPEEGQVLLSNCQGNKKALLIGINYTGTDVELKGCHNDVKNVLKFITTLRGFPTNNVIILTDDQQGLFNPTRENILTAMDWLVMDAAPGDSLFFHYSGHGGQQKDEDGDESDGMDETILPVDYETAGHIVDDLLNEKLVQPLPAGVRLTAIFDSCHSGTVLDLPYNYTCDGKIEVKTKRHHKTAAALMLLNAGRQLSHGDKDSAKGLFKEGISLLGKSKKGAEAAAKKTEAEKSSTADVIQFAGCQDKQTSADAKVYNTATGAMSFAVIKYFAEHPTTTYTELLFGLREILKDCGYKQIPQMATGRPMDMNVEFLV